MKKINRKQFSEMVETTLLEAGKEINSTDLASQVVDLINNEEDFGVLCNYVTGKMKPIILDEEEITLKYTLLAVLQETLGDRKPNCELLSNDLIQIFSKDCKVAFANDQLDFAMNQFCIAFYQYKHLKEKYPQVIKGFEK